MNERDSNWFARNFLIWEPVLISLPPGSPPFCRSCDYCLAGLENISEVKCPECGVTIPLEAFSATIQTRMLRPGWMLKTCSLAQTGCALLAFTTPFVAIFIGEMIAGGHKLSRAERGIISNIILTVPYAAMTGILLGLGVLLGSSEARKYPGVYRIICICIVILILYATWPVADGHS